ncbi:MAG TPA: M20/M25/M40 family metallo-hydrolase [Planctomycetota bacterium]|nr:M20/M25/M40 family metallo-hydrolase [Planctomycetota bacterium]
MDLLRTAALLPRTARRPALALALCTPCLAQAPELPEPPLQPEVTRAELEAHVRFLASDRLAGRASGSEGSLLAAHYLARVLERSGVEPAGDAGTYLQRVPMRRVVYLAQPTLTFWTREGEERRAEWGVDFEQLSGAPAAERLRVQVIPRGEWPPAEPARGAALVLDLPLRERRAALDALDPRWDLVVLAGSEAPGKPSASIPRAHTERGAEAAPRIVVRGDLRERLLRGDALELRLEAPARVDAEAFNVVGRIPGRGSAERAELAEEAIVFSAHYDHLGERPPSPEPIEGEDRIYNGADDDASGCAAVVELAGALAAGEAPARTLVFLLATGEEIGLVGTRHYIEHPAVPLERTVCNLNFEMIGRPDALAGGAGRLWLTGFERSNLGEAFQAAGLAVVPDARPEQRFFERSDNIAFAVRGIVAQTFSSYDLHEDYHTPQDEADRLDYDHMEAAVRAALAAARLVTHGELRPEWKPGGAPPAR